MLLGLAGWAGQSFAQAERSPSLRNIRSVTLTASPDTVTLDTLSLLDISFSVTAGGEKLDTSQYWLDWAQARFTVRDTALFGREVKCVFRVFPFAVESTLRHKSTDRIVQYTADSFYFNPYYYRPSDGLEEEAIDWGQLNYSGSFARGVSFGSSQSLALNSELDLQLTGYIGKDVEITAVLTDNNIPIQPDGNTAQIQDFDKVYIQVRKGNHEVVAGDFETREEESYFMRYYKQLQGAGYSGQFDFSPDLSLRSAISFSIAKGQFTRNTFNGREGNQGPYRLTGANRETFIIVLAGSEKVYVDNVLLERGEERDYVIDYNAGEVTFTPNFLITKDSRIVIEFEYADRNYFRSFIQTGHTLQYKDLKAWFKFYNEADNKNNPINVSLDDEDRALLAGIGDDISQAFISGVNEAGFDPARVLYERTDTTVNAVEYDSIYRFSTDPERARYALAFTYLGPGQGNYEPDASTANGRVFRWVAPTAAGAPTGSYEPVILLITPKKKQVMALGAEYELKDKWTFTTEAALSNYDLNRFSDIGDGDDKDVGVQASVRLRDDIGREGSWKVNASAGYEYKGARFEPIEPYRPVEFNRDWNLGLADSSVNEHFAWGDVRFFDTDYNISYRFSAFHRGPLYTGFKQNLGFDVTRNRWRFRSKASLLNTSSPASNSLFFRPDFSLERDFAWGRGITIGVAGNQELNRVELAGTDSLLAQSFLNNTLRGYFRGSDTSKVAWRVQYTRRTDREESGGDFTLATAANTVDITGDVRALKDHNLQWQFTYRNLQVTDTTLTAERPDNNVLGRINYGFNAGRGAIRFNSVYELGSGQERQRTFTYLRVQPGEGLFSWIDGNSDGLQQQNEFVVSEFADSASYIRVYSNFDDFVQTHVTRFDQSLFINPKVAWTDATGFKGFLARLSLQSSMLINKKSLKSAGGKAFNPFLLGSGREDIVSVNASVRNALYVNRTGTVYRLSYIQTWTQNKLLLLNGIDTRQLSGHRMETLWYVRKFLSLRLDGGISAKSLVSGFAGNDDYRVDQYEAETGAEYTWRTRLRTAVKYNYSRRQNAESLGGERADMHEARWDFKFSLVGKSTVVADFRFVNIAYNGDPNSTKTYEILQGLKPGRNYLWNARYEQKLGGNIQLTLQYEGRQTGDSRVIHTGRAQIRALF